MQMLPMRSNIPLQQTDKHVSIQNKYNIKRSEYNAATVCQSQSSIKTLTQHSQIQPTLQKGMEEG